MRPVQRPPAFAVPQLQPASRTVRAGAFSQTEHRPFLHPMRPDRDLSLPDQSLDLPNDLGGGRSQG